MNPNFLPVTVLRHFLLTDDPRAEVQLPVLGYIHRQCYDMCQYCLLPLQSIKTEACGPQAGATSLLVVG